MATVPEEASIRGSSLTETGYDGEGETYANACKILHDVTFRSLHSNDYNGARTQRVVVFDLRLDGLILVASHYCIFGCMPK